MVLSASLPYPAYKYKYEFEIPGCSLEPTSERCNEPSYFGYCPECNHNDVYSYHCSRWDCPVCHPWTAAHAARRVKDRLLGVKDAYTDIGNNPGYLNHLVISVPEKEYEDFDLKKAKKKAIKYAKEIGIKGGVIVFHPYRLEDYVEHVLGELRSLHAVNGGNWINVRKEIFKDQPGIPGTYDSWQDYVVFSPHFHIVGFFDLKEKSSDFYNRTGWNYKNISMDRHKEPLNDKTLVAVCSYILTHHNVEKGKQSISYFGIAAPNMLEHDVKKVREKVLCPECHKTNQVKIDGCAVEIEEWKKKYLLKIGYSEGVKKQIEEGSFTISKRDKESPEYLYKWKTFHFYRVRTDFKKKKKESSVPWVMSDIVEGREHFDSEYCEESMLEFTRRTCQSLPLDRINKHRVW